MANRDECKAYQESDEMVCPRCGYRWDVNDIDPPKCRTDKEMGLVKVQELRERYGFSKPT